MKKVKAFLLKVLGYKVVKIILSIILSALFTWMFDTVLVVFCFLILTYLVYLLLTKWTEKKEKKEEELQV